MASNSVERSGSLAGSILKGTLKAVGGTLLGVIMIGGAAMAGGLVGLALSFRDLPDVRVLKGYVPVETTYIYDINGELIARLHGDVNREVVTLDRISPHLKRSVLAMEDAYFYTHKGIDPSGIGRAILANFSAGGTVEGGSTLTQQLVKNLFLSNERSLNRKVAEAVLAMRVEQVFTKEQILEMYLNQVFWGKNTNGAETASQNYFGKSAADLNLAEAAMLAGTIQAPSVFNPVDNFAEAKKRQGLVLDRLAELNWATPAEIKAARAQKIVIRKQGISYEASRVPYVSQAVTAELEEKFGKDVVLQGGLRVQTTIDLKLQRIAEEVANDGHNDLVNRGAYADQLALVAVDPRTGFVKALVGGVGDFDKNQYNRAVLARRQLGSSFKPFVYYAAFASGNYTPDSVTDDSPMTIPDGDEPYVPRNYDNKFSGSISIRQAIAVSRNIPALKLGLEVGNENVIAICRKLGINSPMKPVVSLPLGAADVTPMEVAGAYAVFASGGYKSKTTLIARVTDRNGNLILDNTPKPELILDPIAVSYLTDSLRGVVTNGTATEAQMSDGRPVAGKTGTTSDFRDAWFVGYVPQLAVAIWIGNDDYSPMANGVTGGVYVTPIWRKFMEKALAGQPIEQFPVPAEIQEKEGGKKKN
ncbi:MAG: transglycosylase domain-containing protein [Pseudanabaena sp.]|uniref:transglycosylase domain-containing protein n=1 Tax=Pseudanabaena mucicola TaxID=71190 RepID=UPI002576A459|nr:PBP1A family penicillin-binding protein [Pseudanabaena mucicola]MCA6572155.1 PBP1A family penicillin-binding protein [Pseudanabaena sp. M53BS1SP1A06MG]MCA6592741.1 PBP1A family penicillin-binding protein [Pseudanabaena sp. M38BS1SP1A06MG]MCA6596303.1 PBP1A family penicillin-binding protein [Pseudanabaena sp. M046S1SP1A06QC]MCA6611525.1 PBP1A family penicillin-binding protein [Pseudanabaena sp. M158S2SP1A06QC]